MFLDGGISFAFNYFANTYLENVDKEQLKLGLIKGNIELENISIKPAVLGFLNLPFQPVTCNIEMLSIQFSWYIWRNPFRVHLKGISLLADPLVATEQSEVKEKQTQLAEMELSYKALLAELNGMQGNVISSGGFVSALIKVLFQNLVLTVEDLHIRYEDAKSNPNRPFVSGITLKKLTYQYTNSSWEPIHDMPDVSKESYKLLIIDGLALYWQSDVSLKSPAEGKASYDSCSHRNSYCLEPVSCCAKTRTIHDPDPQSTLPKENLIVELEELSFNLTANQCQDIVAFLNYVDRTRIASASRKHRPYKPDFEKLKDINDCKKEEKEYYRGLWRFALNAIREKVWRRPTIWTWYHIKQHRKLVKKYIDLYKRLLTLKKEDKSLKDNIDKLEDFLDVFNIILARRLAETQIQRAKNEIATQPKWPGWLSWLRGSSARTSAIDRFKKELTPEEKRKIYIAAGYEEDGRVKRYPPTFVQKCTNLELKRLRISLRKSPFSSNFMQANLDNIRTVTERCTKAVKTSVRIREFSMDGSSRSKQVPRIVHLIHEVNCSDSHDFFTFDKETNPLDESCDQRLLLTIEPLLIVYDANTISSILSVFQSTGKMEQNKNQTTSKQRIEVMKTTSPLGLEYIIQKHAITDVTIHIKGPCILLPYLGYDEIGQRKLLCKLDSLTIESRDLRKPSEKPSVSEMASSGSAQNAILKKMLSHCYEKYAIELSNFQISSVLANEDGFDLLRRSIFLLKPTDVLLSVENCFVENDVQLPKLIINGQVPAIEVDVDENRLINAMAVFKTYSLPDNEKSEAIVHYEEREDNEILTKAPSPTEKKSQETRSAKNQGTELLANFSIPKVKLRLTASKRENRSAMSFILEDLRTEYTKKSLDRIIKLKLRDMSLNFMENLDDSTSVVSLISSLERSNDLLCVDYTSTDILSFSRPELSQAILKKAEIQMASLAMNINHEAVVDLFQINNFIQCQIELLARKANYPNGKNTDLKTPVKLCEGQTKENEFNGIFTQYRVRFDNLQLFLETQKRKVSQFEFNCLNIARDIRNFSSVIQMDFVKLTVLYPNGKRLWHIVSFPDEMTVARPAFQATYTTYKEDAERRKSSDTSKVDMDLAVKICNPKIVFLNSYIQGVLSFKNNLQQAVAAIPDQQPEEHPTQQEVAQQSSSIETADQPYLMHLDIEIQAPSIMIPQTSESVEALSVNVENLTLKTADITKKEIMKNQAGWPAVLDTIQMDLKDARIHLVSTEGLHVTSQRALLQFTSLRLELTRNLTSAWYFDDPKKKWRVRVGDVDLTLSGTAYSKALELISQNLAEEPSVKLTSPNANITRNTSPQPCDTIQKDSEAQRIENDFELAIRELRCQLYTSNSQKPELVFNIAFETPLSSITAQGFKLCAYNKTSPSFGIIVSAHALSLDDSRPPTPLSSTSATSCQAKRPISQLFYPTNPIKVGSKNMFMLALKRDLNEFAIEFELNDFSLIVYRTYFALIMGFFSSPTSTRKPPEDVPIDVSGNAESTLTSNSPQQAANNIVWMNLSNRILSLCSKVGLADEGRLKCLARIRQSRICMVERFDDSETNTVVLQFDFTGSLLTLTAPKEHEISIELDNLQLYSCPLDALKRQESVSKILWPTHLKMVAKLAQNTKKTAHIDLHIGTTTLKVSTALFSLLDFAKKRLAGYDEERKAIESIEREKAETLAIWDSLWNAKPLDQIHFPFLYTNLNTDDVAEDVNEETFHAIRALQEHLKLTCDGFEIYVATGQKERATPLILLESRLAVSVDNWSQALDTKAILTLQASYFNSELASWEPVVEPVDCSHLGIGEHRPWEMNLSIKGRSKQNVKSSIATEIKVESSQTLDVTITRSFLEVLNGLDQGLDDPSNLELSNRTVGFVVHNQLDEEVLLNTLSDFILPDLSSCPREPVVPPGGKIYLESNDYKGPHNVCLQDDVGSVFHLKCKGLVEWRDLPVSRSSMRYLPVDHKQDNQTHVNQKTNEANVGIIAEIKNKSGLCSIILRGVVQIRNHFHVPIDVIWEIEDYEKERSETENNKEEKPLKQIRHQIAAGGIFSLPPSGLYTSSEELFFAPSGFMTKKPFHWRSLRHLKNKPVVMLLKCTSSTSPEESAFYIQVTGEMKHIFYGNTKRKTSLSYAYVVHLRPAVLLHNSLPTQVYVLTSGSSNEIIVEPGSTSVLANVEPGCSSFELKLKNYMGKDWTYRQKVKTDPEELSYVRLTSTNGTLETFLDVALFSTYRNSTLNFTVHCPFWMINDTGLKLTYKRTSDGSLIDHPRNTQEPLPFSYGPKKSLNNKHIKVRIEDSQWSEKIPLEAAGSSGVATCQSQNGIYYLLGVSVTLSAGGLTRQVVFTPYHILSNLAQYDIEISELLGEMSVTKRKEDWILIKAQQSVPFWPQGNRKLLVFRVAGTNETTVPLSWENPRRTLLQLNNAFGGIDVDFQVSQSSYVIVCHSYDLGRAPFLIVNHTIGPLIINEINEENCVTIELPAKHACYYTWRRPNGSRKLRLSTGEENQDLVTDDLIECFSRKFDSLFGPVHWISFLLDHQRILLITSDQTSPFIQNFIPRTKEMNETSLLSVQLHGIGLSLVDNLNGREIVYISVANSDVIWEKARKDTRRPIYRRLNDFDSKLLEKAYQQYLRKFDSSESAIGIMTVGHGWFVDFDAMTALKPKERILRRTYKHGLEFVRTSSGTRRDFLFSMYTFQIDNQQDDCVFPVVFAPVTHPESLLVDSIPPAFLELRITELSNPRSSVKQYEDVTLTIKDCRFQPDMSLVTALGIFFTQEKDIGFDMEHKQNFELALKFSKKSLQERTHFLSYNTTEHFFKKLKIKPSKLHLSFSVTGGETSKSTNPAVQLLHLVLLSVGVTVTEVQDVVFFLNSYSRSNIFIGWQQLWQDLKADYTGQAIRQLYALVFGLDVIGNPLSLGIGIYQGVGKFLCEPFQGFLHGPEELAEGLELGTRSLVSNTLGGIAGAAAKITGTIGKGISFLTFDKEYQRRRRAQLLRRPAGFGESLAKGGKDLVMEVLDAAAGILMRPKEAIQNRGVQGLVVGLAIGVVGVVARPAAAIFDFTNGTLYALKKAIDNNGDPSRLRLPRHFELDGAVCPYEWYKAEGRSIIDELDKERYAKDDYVDHVVTKKGVLLVIRDRIIHVHRSFLGNFEIEWEHSWKDLASPPVVNGRGLFTPLVNQSKLFKSSTKNERGKFVKIWASGRCEAIVKEIEALMKIAEEVV